MAFGFDRLGALLRGKPNPPQTPPQSAPPEPVVSLWAKPETAMPTHTSLPPARASFAYLRTGRGNYLVAGAPRVDMAEQLDPGSALIAVTPDANRQLCFLLAPDLRPIDIRADGMCATAISAYRMQGDGAAFRLRHPLSPVRFVGVTRPGQGAPDGAVIFDAVGRGKLDHFEPVALDAAAIPPAVERAAAEICAATARPYRAAHLMELLHSLAVRPGLAEPLLRILPRDELLLLARDLLEHPATLEHLQEALQDNIWAQQILPRLASWRVTRAGVQPGGVMHSPGSDEYAGDPLEGFGQPQAGFVLNALARQQIMPRRGACLIACARNEGAYVLEWLAHHRALGFEHAFIYTNDNLDGSDKLLELLAGHGVITLVHNQAGQHCGPQYKMHGHALSLLPQVLDYRWAAIIDMDEYIGLDPKMFTTIDDYLAWQETQAVDAVGLCWIMFIGGRNDNWRDDLTINRFTRREPGANQHVKSIFRPGKFWNSQAHFPHRTLNQPFVFRAEDGNLHHHPGVTDRIAAFSGTPSTHFAWVAHYWLRSAPEALWKVARGHGDWKGNVAERHLEMSKFVFRSFITMAERMDMLPDARMQVYDPALRAELAKLRALPGVAEMEDRIKADFGQRLARMVKAFVDAPANADEPAEFAPFRSVLRQFV